MKQNITLIFLVMSVSLISYAQVLEAGLWKTKSSFKLNGISLPSKEHEECISAAEAKDAKTTIVDALKKESCELTRWEVKKGKLEAALSCKNSDVEASGKIHGTLSTKSYSLEGEADGTYKNAIPSTATLKLSGQWVKRCKKE